MAETGGERQKVKGSIISYVDNCNNSDSTKGTEGAAVMEYMKIP